MSVGRIAHVLVLASVVVVWSVSDRTFAAGQVRPPRPPDVREPAPKFPDGTPNLGRVDPSRGYWAPTQHQDYVEVLVDPKEVPYQSWAKALTDFRTATASRFDPQGFCLPPGGPRLMTTPYPMEILHLPGRIVMIYEGNTHTFRIIHMDGRAHPSGDALPPTWKGHSIGRWEGDTLVVDVVGFNEGSWIDMRGKPHTDQLRIVERYTRLDLWTLRYEATLDDPGAYTRPWTVRFDIGWDPEGELQEYVCQENNRWPATLTDDFGNLLSGPPRN
jgi:hypothetical protein